MAKKKTKVTPKKTGTTRKRKRRSDEELIRDLQDKIRQVKTRQTSRQMQESPPLRATLGVVRAIDKALEVAAGEGETLLRHVLADARKPIAEYLETNGLRIPRANLPRGRRPRTDKSESPPAEE